ncbi:MAG: DUF1289 domain-containing protein [Alphaproteobacteria bacterium]|nr:DUF1289 domain-containing protein [Alphaproteobacteria bacterium]
MSDIAAVSPAPVASPCVGICKMDSTSDLCIGCARSTEEIAEWRSGSEDWRQSVWAVIPGRLAKLGATVQRLPKDEREILDFIEISIRDAKGTWALGVYGGVGEFNRDPNEICNLTRTGDTITAITQRAALKLTVGSAARLLAVRSDGPDQAPKAYCLAVHRSKLSLPVATCLTVLGPDSDAILPGQTDAPLFDVGLGRAAARFCIRTAERETHDALLAAVGLPLEGMLAQAGSSILKHSPTRVIETSMGRVEVATAIPGPGGASPAGPHTHLLPDHLAQGLETVPGLAIPDTYAVDALFYPRG